MATQLDAAATQTSLPPTEALEEEEEFEEEPVEEDLQKQRA